MIHVAVVHPRYADAILAGTKTVESRLSMVRCDPYRAIFSGERLYFKAKGGAVLATTVAGRVEFADGLSPRKVAALRRRFGAAVAADADYWEAKRSACFATFIDLMDVERVRFGPCFPAFHGRAWQRLPDSADVYPRCLESRRRAASA